MFLNEKEKFRFGITSPFDHSSYISYGFLEEGVTSAAVLNIVLFVPYGFLSAIVFQKLGKHWWTGILFGFALSVVIEFLQMFIGRMAQVDDVVMNTMGTVIGFEIYVVFTKVLRSRENNK